TDLALLVIDRLAVHKCYASAHGGDDFGLLADAVFDLNRNGVDLAFLDVDKDQARKTAVSREVEFTDQIGFDRLNSQDDERSEADGEKDYARLISRTIHGVDRVPKRERAKVLEL